MMFAIEAALYLLYLIYLLVRAYAELRSMPYFGQLSISGCVLCFINCILAVLISLTSDELTTLVAAVKLLCLVSVGLPMWIT